MMGGVGHVHVHWRSAPNVFGVHSWMVLWLESRILQVVSGACRVASHRHVVRIPTVDLTLHRDRRGRPRSRLSVA